jgi:hypothetical protein
LCACSPYPLPVRLAKNLLRAAHRRIRHPPAGSAPPCHRRPADGSEFPLAFRLAVEAAGTRHRYIKPRRPQQNGKVERSHRIDSEEFWAGHTFANRGDAEAALQQWEYRYNHERFSLALNGRTPAEKLAAVRAASSPPPAVNVLPS